MLEVLTHQCVARAAISRLVRLTERLQRSPIQRFIERTTALHPNYSGEMSLFSKASRHDYDTSTARSVSVEF